MNPGGVVAQWLPIYESDEETVKTELATFFSVFPDATVWSNYLNGDGYDLVLLGRADSSPIDVDRMQRRLDQTAYSARCRVACRSGDSRPRGSAGDLCGQRPGSAPMMAGAPINEDLNMRLQYIAGMGVNTVTSPQIYREIMPYRKFPEGLLTGSGERMDQLRAMIGRRHRVF